MKILHILSGMGIKDGGTSSCSYALIKGLRKEKMDAEILCYEPIQGDQLIGDDLFIKTVSFPSRNKFLYSIFFKQALVAINTSLYHINGLWEYPSLLTARIARKNGKPYIISPHGMLYPQALKKNVWVKQVFYRLLLKRDLQKAAVIHATCTEEMQHLRNMGIQTPIAIIPNTIDLKRLIEIPIGAKSKKKFGYLGRLHPRKKIETLLYVWAQLGAEIEDAELVIMGSGDDDYMKFLQLETKRLQLKNVIFTGFLNGLAKEEVMDTLSYLAVPSDFENFGMIVIEALALGIPVISSKGTPWQELESYNCGWWIANDVDTFYQFFEKALQLSETERLVMAKNGRRLILEKYDSQIVAKKMVQLYQWVLEKGIAPDYVHYGTELQKNKMHSYVKLPDTLHKINITHCISSIDESTGGPARSITHLIEALGELEVVSGINLLTLESENPLLLKFSNTKILLKFYRPEILKYSYELANKLDCIPTDLFHSHGLWELPIHQMTKIGIQRKIPFVISIRGMLEPWSLKQSNIKKKLAMLLYQNSDLIQASCLHATSLMEMESIRKLGYKNPIANIPNGININNFPLKQYVTGKTKKTILFLSRIHTKKGIEILIAAWQLLDPALKENWCIQIAGDGDKNYINQLNSLIKEKGFEESITIIGSKYGSEKITTYHEADLFVLPTHSENFGIVIAEALCCGVPVITTKGAPWEVLESYNAGKWVTVGEIPLKEALENLMSKTDAEREEMGTNGRKLIEEKFSIESVAERFILLYQWILTGDNKPDFVYE